MGRTLFLTFLMLSAFTKAQASREDILEQTVPGYTVARYAEILDSSDCQRDLVKFRDGVDTGKLWAIKLLDVNGAPNRGFLYGNTFWTGNWKQCYDVTNRDPFPIGRQVVKDFSLIYSPEEQYPPFETVYYSADIGHNSRMTYKTVLPEYDNVTLGLCVPDTCTTVDIEIILNKIFHDKKLLAGSIYNMDLTLFGVKDIRDVSSLFLNGKIICILIGIGIILAISIMSTLYDLLIYRKQTGVMKELMTMDNGNSAELETVNDEKVCPILQPESRMEKAFLCFSLCNNTKSIFDTSTNDENLSSLNGIKVLTMIWMILLHLAFFGGNFADNKLMLIKQSSSFEMQLIFNGSYSTDSFFCMSGFLLMYTFLKKEKTKPSKTCGFGNSIKEFLLLIVKRFVRLTPLYVMIIGISTVAFSWFDRASPFHPFDNPSEQCLSNWWANILYINNLLPLQEMCLIWSWYLSNDMQFYIFGTILLLLSRKYFYLAMMIGGSTIMASIIFTGYIVYIYDFMYKFNEWYQMINVLYFPPWIRIPPYLVGMATAYLLHKCNYTLHLNKRILILCWIIAVVNSGIIIFATSNQSMTCAESVIHTALGRTLWAVGTAWLIVACITNNAGVLNKIFAAKVWIPLSRITYGAYLVNPLLICSMWLYNDGTWHLENFNTMIMLIGTSVMTYAFAYVVSVTTELPFISLFQLFINSDNRRK